jgi:hypothetical protein
MPLDTGVLLYSGSKPFFGARNNLEIHIVAHSKQNCIEIISYNALKGVESTPRIYLAESLLRNKITSEDSTYKVKAKLEKLKQKQARGDIVDFELVERAIWSFAYTSVIIDHIENDSDVPENVCRMYIYPPINNKPPDIICHKPSTIHPYPLTSSDLKIS